MPYIEGSERFRQVVVDDVALKLLDFVFGAESVRVPKVEVDLDEGRMYLEIQGAAQYLLVYATVFAEGNLMRKEEMDRYGNHVHPDEDHVSKAG